MVKVVFRGYGFLKTGSGKKKRKLTVGLSPAFQRIGLKNFLDGI